MITKIIKITILIVWMIIIFLFSSQTGSESSLISDTIVNKTICINNNCNFELATFIIRKFAHLFMYFILGILVMNNFKISKKNIIYALIICILYSVSDEIHQIFSYERSAEIRDIFIDSIGSFIGIIFTRKIKKNN